MLPFDPRNLAATKLSKLKAGDFFLYESHADPSAIGLVLPPLEHDEVHFITLTGGEAFNLRTTENAERSDVIPLRLDAGRIKLRIDLNSAVKRQDGFAIGRVIFGGSMHVAIAGTYHNLPYDRYYNAVSLKDFEVNQVATPRFVFDSWSLSYVDDAGQWADLVRREAAVCQPA